jgi:cytochrome c553
MATGIAVAMAHALSVLAALPGGVPPVGAKPVKGDRELGEYLSAECVTCHQLSGAYQGIPPIIGWPEESFFETMMAYKTKERDNPVMQNIAVKFSEEEIAALAAYFGGLKAKN